MRWQNKVQKRIFKCLSILFFFIILFLLYIFLNKKFAFYIPCPFHVLTGFYCPGCGITRCLFSLFHGDIKQAFFYNMLVFLYLPFLLFYFCYQCYIYILDKRDVFLTKIPKWILYSLLFLTILFGVLRNVPYFSFLAPTKL